MLQELKGDVQYKDRRFDGSDEEYQRALATSVTVYIGNLAFTTREEQLYEVHIFPLRLHTFAYSKRRAQRSAQPRTHRTDRVRTIVRMAALRVGDCLCYRYSAKLAQLTESLWV
jgi:hypothetical protein